MNIKNILVVVGSSHKGGNTDMLADSFIVGATKEGHTVTKVFLGEKEIKGCLGCNACRYGNPCVQKDDMQAVYPILENADVIVIASPLYFWTVSAKLKAFIERLYAIAIQDDNPPLGRYELYPHKDCILLMTAADNFFWTFEQAVSYYHFAIVNYLGWQHKGMVLAGGCGGVDTERKIKQTAYLEEAYKLGSML